MCPGRREVVAEEVAAIRGEARMTLLASCVCVFSSNHVPELCLLVPQKLAHFLSVRDKSVTVLLPEPSIIRRACRKNELLERI